MPGHGPVADYRSLRERAGLSPALGDAVLTWLLDRIRTLAPPGAYVNLLADPPGRRRYARHGKTAPQSVGMALRLS